jgi:hypothetical protein
MPESDVSITQFVQMRYALDGMRLDDVVAPFDAGDERAVSAAMHMIDDFGLRDGAETTLVRSQAAALCTPRAIVCGSRVVRGPGQPLPENHVGRRM